MRENSDNVNALYEIEQLIEHGIKQRSQKRYQQSLSTLKMALAECSNQPEFQSFFCALGATLSVRTQSLGIL